jgi:hypothetical protein
MVGVGGTCVGVGVSVGGSGVAVAVGVSVTVGLGTGVGGAGVDVEVGTAGAAAWQATDARLIRASTVSLRVVSRSEDAITGDVGGNG